MSQRNSIKIPDHVETEAQLFAEHWVMTFGNNKTDDAYQLSKARLKYLKEWIENTQIGR